MITRIIRAVVVGVVVVLVCILLGVLFAAFSISWATAIGGFLTHYAGVLGLLAGLWEFATGFSAKL